MLSLRPSTSRMAPLWKALCAAIFVLAAAPPAEAASDSDQVLDFKYMYYWDRNGVWNHTPAFGFFRKLSSLWTVKWDQEFDAVTGASRRLGLKNIGRLDDNDLKLDGISGASKREIRHSEKVGIAYDNQGRVASASFYFSDENDYRSYSPSVSGSLDFNDRNTTLGASVALFLDEMRPTGPFRGLGGKRDILSLSGTLAQVLSPFSLFGLTANVIHSSGYLGHPYNPVTTTDGTMLIEHLPGRKTALALSGQILQGFHLGERLGSVRLEARHYRDDWELVSNTAEIQWYQYVLDGTYLRLRARGYNQGTAAFAKKAYAGDEVYRTTDIRFYAFTSLSMGLKFGSAFPESWEDSYLLPDRWDISYDQGIRGTKGEEDGVSPLFHYQVFPKDQYYMQGTFMLGLSFDL